METINQVLERFEQISSVPRGTKREQKISQWLQEWAKEHGFSSRSDSVGNLVIYVPASSGMEKAPTVILQGHMDMVCEKTPDSDHDFTRDPIRVIRDGDWLKADRTTLGADNGIAIAIGLALAEDKTASHPPLELLFTVEEEIGIGGASQLDPSMISGKTLVNLDSEEEGIFIVGCAGGKTTKIQLPVSRIEPANDDEVLSLFVDGLKGGHSGVDIHKHRANANKVLGRALDQTRRKIPIQLGLLRGGTAHNAIPRSAEAVFTCPREMSALCHEQVAQFEKQLQMEYAASDPGLKLHLTKAEDHRTHQVIKPAETEKVIHLLMAFPDGVARMSPAIEGFVEASNNLAVIELVNSRLHLTSSQRSTVMSTLDELTGQIEAISHLAGAQFEHTDGYPAWQPNMDSPLLKRSVDVYEGLFHQKPEVKMIHAGLECGIIGDRCGNMDMISLGPTIKNPHSPDEMLYLPSVMRVWEFLRGLLETCKLT
ncbi:MAG: aminoacyl-histidine dipeptidase [Chloroflexi bacterium]|nr:aminoacyl-histidine dipeptidase [Chloroflexota bacterium]